MARSAPNPHDQSDPQEAETLAEIRAELALLADANATTQMLVSDAANQLVNSLLAHTCHIDDALRGLAARVDAMEKKRRSAG